MKKQNKLISCAKNMPPLYHKNPDEKFNFLKSRAVWWLIHQPDILEYLWGIVVQSGSIKYDAKTGKWQGIDFGMNFDKGD